MTTELRLTTSAADCARFEGQLGAWLEQDLGTADQAFMTRHRSGCATCDRMVRDLEQLVADAGALPDLTPPRDLWQGIEARLEAPVIPISSVAAAMPVRKARTVSVRWFAVAATLLVSVSSAVTWQIARSRSAVGAGGSTVATQVPQGTDSTTVETDVLPSATVELAVGMPAATTSRSSSANTRLASRFSDEGEVPDAHSTYEREISALRQIVDERFAELDPGTVTELRRNLDIIDRAIADSKAALASDPRSALGSTQLDRALQAKLDLLRRVALL
jgi:hypothetical protein